METNLSSVKEIPYHCTTVAKVILTLSFLDHPQFDYVITLHWPMYWMRYQSMELLTLLVVGLYPN